MKVSSCMDRPSEAPASVYTALTEEQLRTALGEAVATTRCVARSGAGVLLGCGQG